MQPDEAYFWATHQGAELDLLLFRDGRRLGVEAKRSDAPRMSRSMQIALDDLKAQGTLSRPVPPLAPLTSAHHQRQKETGDRSPVLVLRCGWGQL